MYEKQIICFAASYFTLKTLGYLIGMPLAGTKKYKDDLSTTSKDHYDKVKNDRRIKGYISILLGLILGVCIYMKSDELDIKNRISLGLFAGFFSMSIFYESMWQNKFLFEEKNTEELFKDDTCDENSDMEDIKVYANIYQKHRLIGNIVEVSSICVSIIITLIFSH